MVVPGFANSCATASQTLTVGSPGYTASCLCSNAAVPRARAVAVPRAVIANSDLEAVEAAATAVTPVPDLGVLHPHARSQIDPPPRRPVGVCVSAAAMAPPGTRVAIDSTA